MNSPNQRQCEGHRLLQAGSILFLLGLLVGLGAPRFTITRLAVSAHLLGLMQGTFLMVVGLIWPRLVLGARTSQVGHLLAICGCIAAFSANVAGAAWGAGGSMMPMGTGGLRGTPLQEDVIAALLISAALAMIATAALVVWGLRTAPSRIQ